MTILNCPQVINERGEHETVSVYHVKILFALIFNFVCYIAMVCERDSKLFHWSSYITGISSHLSVASLCTSYSIPGIGGYWKIEGEQ